MTSPYVICSLSLPYCDDAEDNGQQAEDNVRDGASGVRWGGG